MLFLCRQTVIVQGWREFVAGREYDVTDEEWQRLQGLFAPADGGEATPETGAKRLNADS